MLVHQAIYGSDHGGHMLLVASANGGPPFGELAWRTDLPGTAPPGVVWEPYLSGFSVEDYYILSRTLPDRTVARGGMVLTHALFLPDTDARHLADLRGVAELLIREPARPPSLGPLTFSFTDSSAVSASPDTSELDALAEALVARGRDPVVWVGQAGFEDAVVELWSRLWPEMRRTFSFRLSFGPQDCADAPPTVVSTPAPLESRWAGYRMVQPSRVLQARTEAAFVLLGLPEGQALRDFIGGLGSRADQLTDLTLLEDCRHYVAKPDPTVDDLLAAVRLLGRFSPSSGNGVAVKAPVIERLAREVPGARGSVVLSMRNLDVNAFPAGRRVWDAVALWAAKYAVLHATSDSDTARVFVAATPDAAAEETWKRAVWEGFDRAAADTDPSTRPALAAAVWAWWTLMPVLVGTVFNRLPDDWTTDSQLADACPEVLDRAVADLVLDWAARREWYRLHAAAAGAAYPLDEALVRQLAVDRDPASAVGLQILVRRAPGGAIVSAALRQPDSRLITLASQACSKDIELLRAFDVGSSVWRAIWAAAMKSNVAAWRGPAEPHSVTDRLVELSIQGEAIESELWIALAKTPLGNLSGCPRRRELWQTLPIEARDTLLSSTADGWLDRFTEDATFDPGVESELRQVLLHESKLQLFLRQLVPARMAACTSLFRRFEELSEWQFETWLAEVIVCTSAFGGVHIQDAAVMGGIIADRHWRRAAAQLAAAVTGGGRNDLRVALTECQSLLGFWDRVRLSLRGTMDAPGPAADEVWQQFEVTAADLYPKGPDDGELWSRAGGSSSAVRHDLAGQAGWHQAVRLVRHGGGGKITAAALLKVMRKDFPGNDRLAWFAKQDEFRAATHQRPHDWHG
jgi:GTPase-associated protein 1, N-terminal domain type 1/Effector-associated domain 1